MLHATFESHVNSRATGTERDPSSTGIREGRLGAEFTFTCLYKAFTKHIRDKNMDKKLGYIMRCVEPHPTY